MFRMLPPETRELAGQELEVEVVLDGDGRRQVRRPEPEPVVLLGHREVDDRVEPAGERLVDVGRRFVVRIATPSNDSIRWSR